MELKLKIYKGKKVVKEYTTDTIDTIFAQGDKVTICTIPGKLSVVRYSAVTGKEKNILGYFTNDSEWLTIAPGRNIFKFEDDDGNEGYNVKLEFKISPLFGGV